ncbi:uncharacterized protein EAF01_011003 [Botrytis porri]|uniref:uncharacterized protein n=1 Tax=Botrytis porri TaxID=87229 RepID=UPI001901F66A|nr:uncharacterized protein EAF01_011003 [Botrytis porri]KAF7887849.1 hypothetical protein EAF01_011003 [Botrytis porri]
MEGLRQATESQVTFTVPCPTGQRTNAVGIQQTACPESMGGAKSSRKTRNNRRAVARWIAFQAERRKEAEMAQRVLGSRKRAEDRERKRGEIREKLIMEEINFQKALTHERLEAMGSLSQHQKPCGNTSIQPIANDLPYWTEALNTLTNDSTNNIQVEKIEGGPRAERRGPPSVAREGGHFAHGVEHPVDTKVEVDRYFDIEKYIK